MNVITVTGYDDEQTGKVYVLKEIPQVPKSKLYTVFQTSPELYKVADQGNSEIQLLSKDWSSGGSRRHPFQYCFSIYDMPQTTILGWSFIKWGYFRGKKFPSEKVEGVAQVSDLPRIPIEQRKYARFGVFLSKQEIPKHEDWWNVHVEKIFEEMRPVTQETKASEIFVSEDARLKSVLEKLDLESINT